MRKEVVVHGTEASVIVIHRLEDMFVTMGHTVHPVAAIERRLCNMKRLLPQNNIMALLEIVWVILGVERVEYTDYCRLSCLPRGC
jgi:hypothetical protein